MHRLYRWSGAIVFLLLYQAMVMLEVNSFFFQPIPNILRSLISGFASGLLWKQLSVSLMEIAVSFTLATLAGLTLGSLIGRSPLLSKAFEPVIFAIYSVPLFVLYPVFVVWLGLDISSKIAFATVYAFFPITINAIAGFRTVDDNLVVLTRSMGGNAWQTIWKVQLPSSMPAIFAGLRTGLSLALIGVVATEFLVSLRGIGYELQEASTRFDIARLYGITLLIFALGVLVNNGLEWVDRSLNRWRGDGHV